MPNTNDTIDRAMQTQIKLSIPNVSLQFIVCSFKICRFGIKTLPPSHRVSCLATRVPQRGLQHTAGFSLMACGVVLLGRMLSLHRILQLYPLLLLVRMLLSALRLHPKMPLQWPV